MIPEKDNAILETNAEGKKIKFRFDATNRYIFKSFSDNLYSNPNDSVVRELISNAIDANSRAGNRDKPLTIILNNELIIQDSGTGISPEKMEAVYSVYGNSDKRDTNDEIGMYGYGAKSPFAISDQFVLETVPGDGNKYIYVIYKDLSGSGEISLTSCIPSDEPRGTKVRVPIKTTAQTAIKSSIIKYISFLKPTPVTHFYNNYIFRPPDISNESDDYLECKDSYVEIGLINQILYDGWMPYHVPNTTIPTNIFLKLDKKELKLSSSRENVTVTQELKDIMTSKLKKYWLESASKTEKEVLESEDPIHILNLLYTNNKRHISLFSKSCDLIINHKTFGKLSYCVTIRHSKAYELSHSGKLRQIAYSYYPESFNKTAFIYLDENNIDKLKSPYYKAKIKSIINCKNIGTLLLITDRDISAATPIMKELYKIAINLVEYKLPRAPKASSGKKYNKNLIDIFAYNKNGLKIVTVDINEGQYVYELPKHNYAINLNNIVENGITFCRLKTRRSLNRVQKLKNWEGIKSHVTKNINDISKKDIDNIAGYNILNRSNTIYNKLIKHEIVPLDYKSIKKFDPKTLEYVRLACDMKIISPNGYDIYTKSLKNLQNKYPLLAYLNPYSYEDKELENLLVEYIDLINRKEKNA